MSAEANARNHADDFRWWLGAPGLSEYDGRRRDLLALREAVNEMLAELEQSSKETEVECNAEEAS